MQESRALEHYTTPVTTASRSELSGVADVPMMPTVRLAGADCYQPHGDMKGRRELAVSDAQEQVALQTPGGARAKLYELQYAIAELPEVDCPLLHQFAPGVYMRTIFVPAGSVLVGKIHKHAHPNILSQGQAALFTEGGGVEFLTGPVTLISPPGTKRGVFACTDLVWTTIHLTNNTDLSVIEDEIIAKTYEEYEMFINGSDV